MPIHIDRMDTTIELTAPSTPSSAGPGEARSASSPAPAAQTALSDLIGRVMQDELDRFLRNRGM